MTNTTAAYKRTTALDGLRKKSLFGTLDGVTALKAAQFINVFLFALVAGVFWGTWFSLSRSMPDLRPETFLEVGRVMIRNLAGPMSVLVPAALLSALEASYLTFRHRRRGAFAAASAGLLLFGAAMAVTLVVNVPIDNQIKQWTLAGLPPHWEGIRDRWEYYHTIRTFASLAALACALASVFLFRGERP